MRVPIIYILLVGSVFSCQRNTDAGLQGLWSSIGSSRILEVQDNNYTVYDYTSISCFPVRTESLIGLDSTAFYLRGDTLCMEVGVLTYQYLRIDEMPEDCRTELSEAQRQDPVFNFDVFAKTLEENYAFFELNKLSWDSIYRAQRAQLLADPSDLNLLHSLEEIQRLINDNHAYLEADEALYERLEEEEDETADLLKEYGDFEIADLVAQDYLEEDLTKDSWLIRWGKMKDNTGYVQLKAMWLFADLSLSELVIEANGYVGAYVDAFQQMNEGQYIQQEVEGVRKIMDRVMADLAETDRILLDVRFNGGGQDAVSLEILRYFNDQEKVVALQKLRHGSQYSPVLKICLQVATDEAYLKPVFMLTSPQTGSAAETFALASMALPHVRRVGAATSGAMSTALDKTLPNGWYFALSNELFMDFCGVNYENRGVPPDYPIAYPRDRQTFFRSVVNDLAKDKQDILSAIQVMELH